MSKSIHSGEYKTIIKKIRDAREASNLTQQEMAKKLGKPQSYVSKVERGERRVDIIELSKIAKLFKKELQWFLSTDNTTKR